MASAPDDDPLLSWLRSIRQVKQAHPEDKSKLLPCVSDCYKEFRNSEQYRNDPRFLRICVQLADCSPEPLKIMGDLDERGIGHDHALFYEAYATCLESKRRFGDANNLYKRGLSRQAQPTEKLANSYKLFRDRMDSRKKRKQDQLEQHARKNCDMVEEATHGSKQCDFADNRLKQMVVACHDGAELASKSRLLSTNWYTAEGLDISFEELRLANVEKRLSCTEEPCGVIEAKHISLANHSVVQNASLSNRIPMTGSFGEETIQIRNFAAEVITGKEKDVEDARHHGLVDPTINTKEALQDILSMFCKPLDIGKKKDMRKSSKRQGLVSVTVAPSSPLLQDNKRQMNSQKGGQPLEPSVFKDDEKNFLHTEDNGKPPSVSLLPHDKRSQQAKSSLGGLHAQPFEFSVFKDDEQEESQVESSNAARLSPLHDRKRQIISPRGVLQTRSSEFSVFKDDELDEARSKPAVQAGNSLFAIQTAKGEDELPRVAMSEQRAEESGFFVFKDEEVSEEEAEHASNVYRDGEKSECKAQSSMLVESKLVESDLFVFRDEPHRGTLQERKSGLLSHDLEGKMSKGKSIGVNKTLACGIENMLPQSPL